MGPCLGVERFLSRRAAASRLILLQPSSRSPSMPFLQAHTGPELVKTYRLTDGEHILGRDGKVSDITIDVGAVSRRHCRLIIKGAHGVLEDLESRNGTYVNEVLVPPAQRRPLRHGDLIRVCDVVFKFQSEEQPTTELTPRSLLVDDLSESGGSTIMSKLDVVTSQGQARLNASPEARLNAMLEISTILGKASDLDEVLRQILESLFRIFHQADRGFIGLTDASGKLVPRWTKLRRSTSDETIRVSLTIANEVMGSKRAVLSADAINDPRWEPSQSIADFRIRSMMCAPLISSDDKVMGILQIDTLDQRQRFTNEDLALLVASANQASIAIDNARLHEESLARKTLEHELQLAREMHRSFLPSGPPVFPGYDFFDYYNAALQIGGDYYDYIPLPDGRLVVVVADVVGHGVAAALLMVKLSAEVRFCLASEPDPAAAVTQLNLRLNQANLNRFVTLVSATLDPRTHDVTIVNAGHPTPILRRRDGTLESLAKNRSGLPLGIVERQYEASTIHLEPGDSLTLFTDGLDEAMNGANQQFSRARMQQIVKASDGSPANLGEDLLRAIRTHVGAQPQADDMCLVSFRRLVSSGNE